MTSRVGAGGAIYRNGIKDHLSRQEKAILREINRKRMDALTPLRQLRQQRSCGEVLIAHAALVSVLPGIA